jgi:hypothetical protein
MSEEFEKIKMIAKTEEKMAEAWKVTYGSEYDRKGQFYKKVMKIIENSESEEIEYNTPEYFEWISKMSQDEYLRHFKNKKLTVWDYPAKVFEGTFEPKLTEEQVKNGEKLIINNLKEVNGELIINCNSTHSLGSIRKVVSLTVNGKNLKQLPDKFVCKKKLFIGGGIEEIKSCCKIGGGITITTKTSLTNNSFTKLPNDFTVKGQLKIINVSSIKKLPKNLIVKASLEINKCDNLEFIGGITTKTTAHIRDCNNLKEIKGEVNIGTDFTINKCTSLMSLPENMVVKKVFWLLRDTLTEIPDNFNCGLLKLRDSNIEVIGKNVSCRGGDFPDTIKSVGEGFISTGRLYTRGDTSLFSSSSEKEITFY